MNHHCSITFYKLPLSPLWFLLTLHYSLHLFFLPSPSPNCCYLYFNALISHNPLTSSCEHYGYHSSIRSCYRGHIFCLCSCPSVPKHHAAHYIPILLRFKAPHIPIHSPLTPDSRTVELSRCSSTVDLHYIKSVLRQL
jgi:hypothetical protein